jgi:hypothetical protein
MCLCSVDLQHCLLPLQHCLMPLYAAFTALFAASISLICASSFTLNLHTNCVEERGQPLLIKGCRKSGEGSK